MKLKEWGFMRHKPRKMNTKRNNSEATSRSSREQEDEDERDSSTTIERMSIEPLSIEPPSVESCAKRGGWQIVPEADLMNAEPTFMGLLHQAPS
jgi:hypothetical protein